MPWWVGGSALVAEVGRDVVVVANVALFPMRFPSNGVTSISSLSIASSLRPIAIPATEGAVPPPIGGVGPVPPFLGACGTTLLTGPLVFLGAFVSFTDFFLPALGAASDLSCDLVDLEGFGCVAGFRQAELVCDGPVGGPCVPSPVGAASPSSSSSELVSCSGCWSTHLTGAFLRRLAGAAK
jgi:hypothetical protein